MIDLLRASGPIALAMLAIAMVLVFVRLVRGPSLADRVVALDLLATIGVSAAVVYAITFDAPVFLDVAIVLALISFIGTVAFAKYVERGVRP